ncbi:MAG: site-2 protease family protein [Fimbriimonadaceae bacterium]|nr:site-2 protease family protein [Fimbriimonadaceae bacterium]
MESMLATGLVIFLAIGLHEYAHCKMADLAGDPTPSYYGRVTLNLTKHFELMGTIMIIITTLTGFGIGWGKPAPMDPRKMRNPKWDFFAAVAAGPLSNLLQAVVFAMILRVVTGAQIEVSTFVGSLLLYGVIVNLSLCFFNLIPLGPLDGHWLLGTFLPENVRLRWIMFNRQYGGFLLLGLILFGQMSGDGGVISKVLGPPVWKTFEFLTGFNPLQMR